MPKAPIIAATIEGVEFDILYARTTNQNILEAASGDTDSISLMSSGFEWHQKYSFVTKQNRISELRLLPAQKIRQIMGVE